MSTQMVTARRKELVRALGQGVIECWATLEQETQRMIFEAAVAGRDELMRQELAEYLHNHHPRTERDAT